MYRLVLSLVRMQTEVISDCYPLSVVYNVMAYLQ